MSESASVPNWREELADQRKFFVTTEKTQQAAWAAMLDATSTTALAEQIIKKVSRSELGAIVSEWLEQQDFRYAMNGVEEEQREGEDDEDDA